MFCDTTKNIENSLICYYFLFFFKFIKTNFDSKVKVLLNRLTPSPDGRENPRHFSWRDWNDSRKKLLINMKNTFIILFLSFLVLSCQQKIKPADLANINGYWEIERVGFDQGEDKQYGMNESYDYFEIGKNNSGFRKKVMPQLDGTFIVNDTYENVKIRFKDDQVFMDYVTPYAKWTEELIAVSKDKLVFVNQEKKEYHYKKAEKLNILGDGKKTK